MQIPAGSVLSAQGPLFGVAFAFSKRFLPLSALVEIPMTTTDLITADELLLSLQRPPMPPANRLAQAHGMQRIVQVRPRRAVL